MNNKQSTSRKAMTIGAAVLALCMGAGSVFAQGRGDDRGPGGQRQEQREDRRDNRDDRRDDRRDRKHDRRDNRRDARDHRFDARQDYRPGSHYDRNGYQPRPADWRRGGRLPPEYRNHNYVVNDYRAYQLQAPPRGYQWVGVGGEFALAAIATGIIAQIIVNR